MNSTVLIRVNISTIENGSAEMLLQEAISYLSNNSSANQLELKNKLTNYLNENNLRKTPERYKILEKICLEKKPFTMNTIHSRVLKDMYVSLRTVNRVFRLLVDSRIIKKINSNEKNELFKTTYFELNGRT
ncbi:transcriptional repressor [Tenacibaculum maritimum]|uniref:transcriptional repressor n=1 Tax=Tenacibaculum maritimum TaxID=107401 RepID=UPI003876B389